MIRLYDKNAPENEQPTGFRDPDLTKRRIVAHWGFSVRWDGGNDSTEHETDTPHVAWIGIPGKVPIVAVEEIPGTRSPDGRECRIVAQGTQAAEYLGTAHI